MLIFGVCFLLYFLKLSGVNYQHIIANLTKNKTIKVLKQEKGEV